MEDFDPQDYTLEKRILVGIGIFIAVVIVFVVMTNKPMSPQEVVEEYIDSLSDNQCRRAYDLVHPETKEYYSNYRKFSDFKSTVCEPAKSKYDRLYVKNIDNLIAGSERTEVYFQLGFKPALVPNEGVRGMNFALERVGKRWLIVGPFLEP